MNKDSNELSLVYIAAPYYHENQMIMQLRHEIINKLCSMIITEFNCSIFSPISHGHMINTNMSDDFNAREYWMNMDLKVLHKCSHMFVLMMDGWKESVGVNEEIAFCAENDIPVDYIDPSNLINMEGIESVERAILNSETKINILQFVVGEWADETFSGSNTESILAHMRDEVEELAESDIDRRAKLFMDSREDIPVNSSLRSDDVTKEAADVGLLLLHYCHKTGIDLGKAMVDKFRINQQRTWSEEKNKDGYFSHIEEDGEQH